MKINFKALQRYMYIRFFKQNYIIKRFNKEKKYYSDTINIVISTNKKFLEQTMVYIFSLENCLSNVNLYIFNVSLDNEDIIMLRKVLPKNVQLIEIKIEDKLLNKLKISEKWPIEAWSRILIPELVDEKVVIYTDVDCLVLANLKELNNIGNKYPISGVRSTYYYKDKFVKNAVNSGVLVLNCEKLREFDFTNKVLKYAQINKEDLVMPDQDTINNVCSEIMHNIDLKFNSMNFLYANTYKDICNDLKDTYYSEKIYNDSILNPVIIHYNGGPFARPWENGKIKHPYYKLYQYYKNNVKKILEEK